MASIRLFPQVYRTVTVNCSSVSLATLFLDFMSCVFFLIYAIHMNTMPMIISNRYSKHSDCNSCVKEEKCV